MLFFFTFSSYHVTSNQMQFTMFAFFVFRKIITRIKKIFPYYLSFQEKGIEMRSILITYISMYINIGFFQSTIKKNPHTFIQPIDPDNVCCCP